MLAVTSAAATASCGGRISSGEQHTCALKVDGFAQCWGSNEVAQSAVPASSYSIISNGGFHTCALKTTGGLVECWGQNVANQVGGLDADTVYVDISAGSAHTCAIKSSDRTVVCWGLNNNGQCTVGSRLMRRYGSTLYTRVHFSLMLYRCILHD